MDGLSDTKIETISGRRPLFQHPVRADEYCVMPNHFHGIVTIVEPDQSSHVGADLRVCPGLPPPQDAHAGASLPQIMQWFKTMSANDYIRGVGQQGWAPFPGKLWQRNYYEHVIRDDAELSRVREYIASNPAKWYLDAENPQAGTLGRQRG
ncbi:MAG: hypothetical protein EXR54_07490 [Dehalococcoidia bacterium]|nr:hypothetical protein [Dehalococcoidia bacterium]